MSAAEFRERYGLLIGGLALPLVLVLGLIFILGNQSQDDGYMQTERIQNSMRTALIQPSSDVGDLIQNIPTNYQGDLEGKVRRLRLHSINPQGGKAAFLYSLLLGSRGDQEQAGSMDFKTMRFSLSSIGEGKMKLEGQSLILIFDDNLGELRSMD